MHVYKYEYVLLYSCIYIIVNTTHYVVTIYNLKFKRHVPNIDRPHHITTPPSIPCTISMIFCILFTSLNCCVNLLHVEYYHNWYSFRFWTHSYMVPKLSVCPSLKLMHCITDCIS